MSREEVRLKLHEYNRYADDKRVKAIYTMLEVEIEEQREIWTKPFIAEMQRRAKGIESGKVKGKTRSEVDQKVHTLLKK